MKKSTLHGAFCRLYTNNFARFKRARADVDALRLAVNHNANLLYINSPSPFCFIVGMGNVIAFFRRFAGDEAFA